MATYKITAELNLKKIVNETREVVQALKEFADNLEQIEKKYAEPQESEDKEMSEEEYELYFDGDLKRDDFLEEESEDKEIDEFVIPKNFLTNNDITDIIDES